MEAVHLIEGPGFQAYKSYRQQRVAMQHILFEALHVVDLTTPQKETIEHMLSNPTEKTIALARAQFNSTMLYPYLSEMQKTAPDDGVFSFTAWGDSQSGWDTFQTLVLQMTEIPSAFSIGLGDLVGFGSKEEEWVAFTVALQPLLKKRVVFPVPGNHDYDGYYNDLVPELYYRYTRAQETTQSYFSWTHGGAFFLALDPNRNFPLGIEWSITGPGGY